MITLKEAIRLLSLDDNDIVYICKERHETFANSYSIREIRNKFDMKKTMVKKIYPTHFIYGGDLDWEFIV